MATEGDGPVEAKREEPGDEPTNTASVSAEPSAANEHPPSAEPTAAETPSEPTAEAAPSEAPARGEPETRPAVSETPPAETAPGETAPAETAPAAPTEPGQLLAQRLGRGWQPADPPPDRAVVRLLAALFFVPCVVVVVGALSVAALHGPGGKPRAETVVVGLLVCVAGYLLHIARANGRRLQPEWGLALALLPWVAGRAGRIEQGGELLREAPLGDATLHNAVVVVTELARRRVSEGVFDTSAALGLIAGALAGIALYRDDPEETEGLREAAAEHPIAWRAALRDRVVLAQPALVALLGALFALAFCVEPQDCVVLVAAAVTLGAGLHVRRLARACASVPTSEWAGPLRKRVAITAGLALGTMALGRGVFHSSLARLIPEEYRYRSYPYFTPAALRSLPSGLPVDAALPAALLLVLVAGLALAWYPERRALKRAFSRRAGAVALGLCSLALLGAELGAAREDALETEAVLGPMRSLDAPPGVQLASHHTRIHFASSSGGLTLPPFGGPAAFVDAQGSLWLRSAGDDEAARADSVTLARVFEAPRPRPTRALVLFDERVTYAAMGRALRPLLVRNVALHAALPAEGLAQRGPWSVYNVGRAQHYLGLPFTFVSPRRLGHETAARLVVGPGGNEQRLLDVWGRPIDQIPHDARAPGLWLVPESPPYGRTFAEVHDWARASGAYERSLGGDGRRRILMFPHPDAP